MDREQLLTFIRQKGYRTQSELREKFSDVDEEMLETHLQHIISRHSIGIIIFGSPEGEAKLYYAKFMG